MDNFPSPIAPDRQPRPKWKNRKTLWIVLAIIVVLLLLLFLIPELFAFVATVGIILGIIGMVKGKVPWLPIRGRSMSGWFGFGMVILMFISGAIMGPQETNTAVAEQSDDAPVISSESPSPTPSESPSPTAIADFVGQECEGDELVMEQGAEKLYCDESTAGVLVWANQDDHDKTILAAKKVAEAKAEKEKAAAEKKAAEKAAAEKKVAEKKAAEKAEAKAATKKAEQKAEAKRIAQQEEAARIAEQEAIEEAYEAPAPAPVSAYYANCSEVRSAGAAPIYSGDPGYSSKLDRDGDGVACE